MLLQTNSYIVPAEKRTEHQRLIRRFRQAMARLGCDMFEVYEQVGPNWAGGETTGRYVQIMRFRDHQHQRAVQAAERTDATAQALIAEFCDLINLPYQQQQGLFAVGFYRGVVKPSEREQIGGEEQHAEEAVAHAQAPPPAPEQEQVEEQMGAGDVSPVEQPVAEVHGFVPEEQGVEALADHEPHGGNNEFVSDQPAFQEEQVEIDIEAQPAGERQPSDDEDGHRPGHHPAHQPTSLDDLDLEALAQEELSEMQENQHDDRAPHRG